MKQTIQFTRELKGLNVSAQVLAMVDLVAVGYNETDAYLITHKVEESLEDKKSQAKFDKLVNSVKYQKLLATRKSRIKEGYVIPTEIEEVGMMDGDEVAKEILRSAKAAPVGSKERADLFLRYDEIRQRNQPKEEENEDGTENINFYYPVKCSMCPLFSEFKKLVKNDGVNIRPEDMGGIIRKAIKLAYPNAMEAYEKLHGTSYAKAMRLSNNNYEAELAELKKKYNID